MLDCDPAIRPFASFDWRSRTRAALIHLAANTVVAAALALLVFVAWYPWPYRNLSGGTELFRLVVSVDVVMGPVITWVIFNRKKRLRELARDISVIVALQIAALAYGLYMVAIARPAVLALEQDRFRVVAAEGVLVKELSQAPSGLQSISLWGPRLVYAAVPTDPVEKSRALELGFAGYDIGARPSLWRAWDAEARLHAAAAAKPLSELVRRSAKHQAEIAAAVERSGRDIQALGFIPMITLRGDWVALVSRHSGDVVGFAPVDGF